MQFNLKSLLAVSLMAGALMMGGCNGNDGANGTSGKDGVDRTLAVQDAGKLTATDLKNISLEGAITGVDTTGNQPVVRFSVYNKQNHQGIAGLRTFSLHIAQLKPAVNSSNSYWQNYIADGLPQTAMPARSTAVVNPSTDSVSTYKADGTIDKQGYSVVDNLDGTYVVTFGANIKANTKVPYDASLVHRVAVGVRSVAVPGVAGKTPGQYAGPINPDTGAVMAQFLNTNGTALVYDFIPATGAAYSDPATGSAFARDIVNIGACNQCHTRLEHGSNNTSGHFGSRPDTKVCVICHTPQLTAIAAFGEGDFTTFIHKIHMGEELPAAETAPLTTELNVNEIVLPMDVRNCTICHKGAVVDSWKTTTRKACGSCHNNVNFATGANHPGIGGARTDDTQCVICHSTAYVTSVHATDYATPNNPQTPTGLVNFKYEIASATVNGSNQAVIKFRILSDGGTGAAMAPVTLTAGTGRLTGFTTASTPAFLLAFNKAATNQAASIDYNNAGLKAAQPVSINITNLADGTKGTLSAPDPDGYYTATINADAGLAVPTSFPVGAKMRTVALQGYFTQASPASGRHTISVVKTVTGDTPRRVVIDSGKCGACHEVFEGHGGSRNIGKDTVGEAVCTLCHVPNLSSSGRGIDTTKIAQMSAAEQALLTADGYTLLDPTTYPEETNNFKDMIHGIHAGSSRSNPLNFVRDRSTVYVYFSAANIKFPGVLKYCEACHTSTSYKSVPANTLVTTDETTDGTAITTLNNVAAVAAARSSLPNAQDLVTTPFTAACVSCHDLPSTVAHMKQNGGQVKVLRSAAIPANEACATCHGATGTASIFASHRF